jgi:hypothetical protein
MRLNDQERKEFIKKDLTRWLDVLGISVKKEFREVPCYSLVTVQENKQLIAALAGETQTRYNYPYDSSYLNNERIGDLLEYLNRYNSEIPMLISNNSGLPDSFRVSMRFSKDAFSGLQPLKNELKRYGFDLVPSSCRVEMYVITEHDLRK